MRPRDIPAQVVIAGEVWKVVWRRQLDPDWQREGSHGVTYFAPVR